MKVLIYSQNLILSNRELLIWYIVYINVFSKEKPH